MKTFKLAPEGFKKIRRKTFARVIPVSIVAALAGIYISSTNQNIDTPTVDVLPFLIPLIALSIGYGHFFGIKRQRKLWDSYTSTSTPKEHRILYCYPCSPSLPDYAWN